jgi:hypothetical protein
VNAVRSAASDIFDVERPQGAVPQVAEERGRYFYIFLHVGTTTESFERLLRCLLPPPVLRRRLLMRARHDLASEFDKHAGRRAGTCCSGSTLSAVRRRFEVVMASELDRSVETILAAAVRAEEMRSMAEAEREERKVLGEAAREAARAALALTGGS